jgi:DNA invertase Pin-like site-specific DNA recombinase
LNQGISGGKYKERDGLLQALAFLREHEQVRALVVNKFDRYFREVGFGEVVRKQLQRHGKTLESVQEQMDLNEPSGEAHFQMNLVFAEWERKTIFKRTYSMRMSNVERGAWIGYKPPFGWRPAYTDANLSALVPVPDEQRVIRFIRRCYKWTKLTQRNIVDLLNRKMEIDPVRWGPKATKELKRPRRTPYLRKRTGKWTQPSVWKILAHYREVDAWPSPERSKTARHPNFCINESAGANQSLRSC